MTEVKLTVKRKPTTKRVKKVTTDLTCTCCGETKHDTEFYSSQSEIFKFKKKMCVCKSCAIDVIFEFYKSKYKGDEEAAIYRTCELLDVYYTEILIESARKEFDNRGAEDGNIMKFYLKDVAMPQYNGLTFEDRKLKVGNVHDIVLENEKKLKEKNEEDKKVEKDVERLLGYDPFEGYTEIDKHYLYSSLLAFLNEDTLEDGIKLSAYIQIVNNNNQIRKIDLVINDLNSDIKKMLDNAKGMDLMQSSKSKVVTSNDKIMKENSISVKNRGDKKAGRSTLTYMMRDLRELDFDDAEEDYYSQNKAYGMKMVADISNKSILEQLSFDENDYVDMLKTQKEIVENVQVKIDDMTEENRSLYQQIESLKKIIANDKSKEGIK
jgi:hypothetical protein